MGGYTYTALVPQEQHGHRMMSPPDRQSIEARVKAIGSWYHAIDLGDGLRTPGAFHMASFLEHYDFPADMTGMRVLDVGASNGFFSFEFDRRGAAEVVAVDLPGWKAHDWTPRYRKGFDAKRAEERDDIDRQVMRAGFDLVREVLGCSRVKKVEMAIYDLMPERVGMFDMVFCGSMLMHVRDPVLGIQRMRSVCRDDGKLIISIAAEHELGDQPVARFVGQWDQCNWWHMSPRGLEEMLACCDFAAQKPGKSYVLTDTTGQFKDPTYVCHAKPMTPGAG